MGHDPGRYRGKKLGYLLLALCLPAGLLYLRLVFGLAAADTRVLPAQAVWLARLSLASLVVFFLVQAVCARYLQRIFWPPVNSLRDAIRYIGVLLFCVLFSLTGAITLEAFGMNVFLRAAGIR